MPLERAVDGEFPRDDHCDRGLSFDSRGEKRQMVTHFAAALRNQDVQPIHHMRLPPGILAGVLFACPAIMAAEIRSEIGASFFAVRHARLEQSPSPLSSDEPGRTAPYVAATYGLNERIAIRLSYHYLNDVRTTAQFAGPPGIPPSPLPVFVSGHYVDDVHVLSVAPEYHWAIAPALSFSVAPQLNWVTSRGVVSYSTNSALILLVAPRERNDEGFTWGGAVRMQWSLGARAALAAGYQFVDLEPSFDREAHVFSAGLSWKF